MFALAWLPKCAVTQTKKILRRFSAEMVQKNENTECDVEENKKEK